MEILGGNWLEIKEPLGIKTFLSPHQPLGHKLINPQFLTPLEWKIFEETREEINQEIKKNQLVNNNREDVTLINISPLALATDNGKENNSGRSPDHLANDNLNNNLDNLDNNTTVVDIPNSWSSIDELIGETALIPGETITVKPLAEINQWENDLPILSFPQSPNNNINYTENNPTETSNKITITSKFNPNTDSQKKAMESNKINTSNIEDIAREVYDTIKQWLEIERERYGNHYFR